MLGQLREQLCKHKDMFGKPGEGVHRHRLFGIAIVDLLLTILGAIVISKLFHTNVLLTIVVLILLGIFSHWLFCVDTALNKALLK